MLAIRFYRVPPELLIIYLWLRTLPRSEDSWSSSEALDAGERECKTEAKRPRGSRRMLMKQQGKEPEAIESGSLHFICSRTSGTFLNSKSNAVSFCI